MRYTIAIFVAALLLLPLLIGCGEQRERETVLFIPAEPEVADSLTILYSPDTSSPLASAQSVYIRYMFLGERDDVRSKTTPMRKKGNSWEITFIPNRIMDPPPLVFVCAFVDGSDQSILDNNRENAWAVFFHDNGTPLRGARHRMYRILDGGDRLPDALKTGRDEKRAGLLLKEEIEENPEYLPARIDYWSNELIAARDDSTVLDSLAPAVRAQADLYFHGWIDRRRVRDETTGFLSLYNLAGAEAVRDSLARAIMKRFPDDPFTPAYAFHNAIEPDDPAEAVRLLEEFLRTYPGSKEAVGARTYLVYIYIRYLDLPELVEPLIRDGEEIETYALAAYAEHLLDEGKDPVRAVELLKRCVREEYADQWKTDSKKSQWEWLNDRNDNIVEYAYSMSQAQFENGNTTDAEATIRKLAMEMPERTRAEMLLDLASYQKDLGKTEEWLDTYDLLARKRELTEEELAVWRPLYTEKIGDDFDAHYTEIREKSRADVYASLSRTALHWPVEEMRVLDENGETITLTDFLGKPVVIDFWATWCGPCIRALPHVDKIYREIGASGDIVFLPINVWERTDGEERHKTVRAKWDELELTMPIYYDVERGDTTGSASALFGVNAIPTTCLIGKDGTLLFKTVGFNTGAGEADLRLRIEFALAE